MLLPATPARAATALVGAASARGAGLLLLALPLDSWRLWCAWRINNADCLRRSGTRLATIAAIAAAAGTPLLCALGRLGYVLRLALTPSPLLLLAPLLRLCSLDSEQCRPQLLLLPPLRLLSALLLLNLLKSQRVAPSFVKPTPLARSLRG